MLFVSTEEDISCIIVSYNNNKALQDGNLKRYTEARSNIIGLENVTKHSRGNYPGIDHLDKV